jgi:alkyl sulfatase BDS1-like metallo-beta-lactamase superfamily hydrolase
MCGSDVDLSCYDYRFVFVFDNEPRNRQIVNKIDKTISQGQRVVIYPKGVIDKDLNDMVLSGLDVQEMVKSNIYSGLEAKLKLNEWKKV